MKTLFSLAKYNSNNFKIIELLVPQKEDAPLKELLSIVFSDKIMDDYQAMKAVYGKVNLSSFSKLKARLRDILIKATLLQNSRKESIRSRINETTNLFRHTLTSKMLINEKLYPEGIGIAEKALFKSIKYNATENVIILIRLLVVHYSSRSYNKNKLNKFLAIQAKYLNIYFWERKAENYYFELQQTNLYSLSPATEEIKERAKNYFNELENVNNVKTISFCLNKFRVKAAYYEFHKDYHSLLTLIENALVEFRNPYFKSQSVIASIILRKTWALIQSGRYEETIKIGLTNMRKYPNGSNMWYFIAHYILKAQLYKEDYISSIQLIKIMIEHPDFSKLGGSHKELFTATLGYIHLIVNSGIAGDVKRLQKNLPDFKIGKFINTTPVFSKDKRGINISILLLHIAVLLQRKNYNAIIDRIDSLTKYAYQYLRKDDTFRSNCMIKMVIQMTKADFHPVRTERYTRDLLKQLEHVKLAGSGENIETEIIPYEVLWKIMSRALVD